VRHQINCGGNIKTFGSVAVVFALARANTTKVKRKGGTRCTICCPHDGGHHHVMTVASVQRMRMTHHESGAGVAVCTPQVAIKNQIVNRGEVDQLIVHARNGIAR